MTDAQLVAFWSAVSAIFGGVLVKLVDVLIIRARAGRAQSSAQGKTQQRLSLSDREQVEAMIADLREERQRLITENGDLHQQLANARINEAVCKQRLTFLEADNDRLRRSPRRHE